MLFILHDFLQSKAAINQVGLHIPFPTATHEIQAIHWLPLLDNLITRIKGLELDFVQKVISVNQWDVLQAPLVNR